MAEDTANPMTPSSDHIAMLPYWRAVDAVLGGVEKLRHAGQQRTYYIPGPAQPVANLNELQRGAQQVTINESPYLPMFPNELPADYEFRRCHAPLNNLYEDISRNLASKPFSKELQIDEKSPDQFKALSRNIDGQGNNFHVFGADVFKAGLDYALDWILVDYTKVAPGSTLDDERKIGARPYWVRIPAQRMLAAYSTFLNGKEIKTYARIYEPTVERRGYEEVCVERVREFEREPIIDGLGNIIGYSPAKWKISELIHSEDANGKDSAAWIVVDEGAVTIGEIPLVAYYPGKRHGTTWLVDPELRTVLHMQLEEFQQESNLKDVKIETCYPMLAANGIDLRAPGGGEVTLKTGPKAVLYCPPNADGTHGEFTRLEPGAQSLIFLKDDLQQLRTEMSDRGMQPLAAANLTVITTANVSMKAHSAAQKWAIKFKVAMEEAWLLTAKWLNATDKIEVVVHTDFAPEVGADNRSDALLKAAAQNIISNKEAALGLKRFGYLPDDYDWDKDELQKAIEQEGQQLQPEKMIDPVTGAPVVVTPQHGEINPPPATVN